MFCVNNLGELVKAWRKGSGLAPAELAERINKVAATAAGKAVRRQHIQQLEKEGSRTPRYLADLAEAMGTTVKDLVALRMPRFITKDGSQPAPPAPPRDFRDPEREMTDSDWVTLDAVKNLLPAEQLEALRRQYVAECERVEAMAQKRLAELKAEAGLSTIGPSPPSDQRAERKSSKPFNLSKGSGKQQPTKRGSGT